MSRAKWLRVPAGMQTYGMSCLEATAATIAWEPSPPAMPMTSAPDDTAAVANDARSSPSFITTGSIPRARHRPTRS